MKENSQARQAHTRLCDIYHRFQGRVLKVLNIPSSSTKYVSIRQMVFQTPLSRKCLIYQITNPLYPCMRCVGAFGAVGVQAQVIYLNPQFLGNCQYMPDSNTLFHVESTCEKCQRLEIPVSFGASSPALVPGNRVDGHVHLCL